ncbi:MAG: PAS domain S-box protein, partial [Candidatus Eremiobacteraeota bacterium]|nr:PAS domain S-box protein [Candidatus Eremiobacteraeota bacterium]
MSVSDSAFHTDNKGESRSPLAKIVAIVPLKLLPSKPAEMFVSLVENSGDFIGIASLEGRVLYMNASGRELIEVGSLDDARGHGIEDFFLAPDLAYVRNVILPAVRSDGRWRGDFRFRNVRTGEAVAVDFNVFYIRDEATGEPVALATVSQDIAERRLSEQRLRTLVDAGATLTSSLDYATTFENLAELVVRSLATFCVIVTSSEQANGGSRTERIASFHADPLKRPIVERVAVLFAPPVDGSSSLIPHVDAEWLQRGCDSPECADLFRALGVRSLLTVPLKAGGRVLGALTCGLSEEDP